MWRFLILITNNAEKSRLAYLSFKTTILKILSFVLLPWSCDQLSWFAWDQEVSQKAGLSGLKSGQSGANRMASHISWECSLENKGSCSQSLACPPDICNCGFVCVCVCVCVCDNNINKPTNVV